MHFIKLSSENVYIHTYFNAHRRLISIVSLTSSSSHSFIHTCLIVCFFSPVYVQFIMTITQFSISLCISIYGAYRESRRRQVSHAVYLLEGITSAHLEKHIYTHAPGCEWYTNTHYYIIHLYNFCLLSHSLINRR
jgi:uncharacterized membrane protein